MLDLHKKPFNWLPLNQGDLFDLTCEYTISLLERLNRDYDDFCTTAQELTQKLPAPGDFDLHKNLFAMVDGFLDNYSKLVKCVKLSLGQNVGRSTSKQIVFGSFAYSPNESLQNLITHKLRNTQQHFEERLQDYQTQIDPFLLLFYRGQNIQWRITFGNGGYKHGGSGNNQSESFNSENLFFKSYEANGGSLINHTVKINDIWKDILEITKLIEENMENVIKQKNISCPPVRNVGAFVTPG